MKLLASLIIFFFNHLAFADQVDTPYLEKDDPAQLAQLVCSEQVNDYHRSHYRKLNREYAYNPTPVNHRAIYEYAQVRREFRERREEYLGELVNLRGSRFGVWDNRYRRTVSAGFFTRNVAHEGFARALRNRGIADGMVRTAGTMLPMVDWGELRDSQGQSIFLADLLGSDEFIQELVRCQNHYGVQVPNLYDSIVSAAEVDDVIGLRIGQVGTSLASLVGGMRVASLAARGAARLAPATAERLSRIPGWVGWTTTGAGLAAIVFPIINRRVRQASEDRQFIETGDINTIIPLTDVENWRELYGQLIKLRDLIVKYQDSSDSNERDRYIMQIACFVREDMQTQYTAIERIESILYFYQQRDDLSGDQQTDQALLIQGRAFVETIVALEEEYYVNCPQTGEARLNREDEIYKETAN